MKTIHKIFFRNSSDMRELESNSIDLMITSPPYPMIEMWDLLFSSLNDKIKQALKEENGEKAFELMHEELAKVWKEVSRVLKPGGIACLNIGDATRKIGKIFQLFPNHVKIINFFKKFGFIELPCILWRKPTNTPNKFLGSGMLPPNAYVTLEHEYILIFRKGTGKRVIPPKSENRYHSAFFWEERNNWFSDIWNDIRGTSQNLDKHNSKHKETRDRSAAYPLDLPYRLINMFSLYGDVVLDPFWGTGTTSRAAMTSARNSIGYEINADFLNLFKRSVANIREFTNKKNYERLNKHVEFIKKFEKDGKATKYTSVNYKFPVVTNQEVNLLLYNIKDYKEEQNNFILNHETFEFKI